MPYLFKKAGREKLFRLSPPKMGERGKKRGKQKTPKRKVPSQRKEVTKKRP